MTLDQEVRDAIGKLKGSHEIIESWEGVAALLSESFPWAGSKIDWDLTCCHDCIALKGGARRLESGCCGFYF